MKLAICAIALNENPYLAEWTEYHFDLGVDRIFLYDNSPDRSLRLKRRDPRIVVTHWPGKQKQTSAYTHCIERCKDEPKGCIDCVGMLDIDEFVWIDGSLPTLKRALFDFMTDPMAGEAAIHWRLMSHNNLQKQDGRPVTQRFMRSLPPGSMHDDSKGVRGSIFKVFVKPGRLVKQHGSYFMDPHRANLAPSATRLDLTFNVPNASLTPRLPWRATAKNEPRALVYHYFCKSIEEWKKKIERGRADTGQRRTVNIAARARAMDKNDRPDDRVWKSWQARKRRNAGVREAVGREKDGIIVYAAEKSNCTQVVEAAFRKLGLWERAMKYGKDWVHNWRWSQYIVNQPPPTVAEITAARQRGCVTLKFVRDPIARMRSMFTFYQRGGMLTGRYPILGTSWTVDQFLDYCETARVYRYSDRCNSCNEHIASQAIFGETPNTWTEVIRVESLKTAAGRDYLQKRYGLVFDASYRARHWASKTAGSSSLVLTPAQVARVRKIWWMDF